MKTIGLIGGMSWESSQQYYRIINEETRRRLGGLHSAQCIMFSFDFAEIERLQTAGKWYAATTRMVEAAQSLERGGADFLLICANTMHKMAADVERSVSIPLVHIVDPTARAVKERGARKVGLLGTRYTMEEAFYRGRLSEVFDLEVVVPDAAGRKAVHKVIYDELCQGKIRAESKKLYLEVIGQLGANGAQGIILGCTEIGLLVGQDDTQLPLFDTTRLHAECAVDMMLA